MRTRRGSSLIELLVGSMVSLIVGAVVIYGLTNGVILRDVASGENRAYELGRTTVDSLADHLRNAQRNPQNGDRVLASGTRDSIQYYAYDDDNLVTVRYFRHGNELRREDPEGTRTMVTGLDDLEFSYFVAEDYTAPTWSPTANPHQPSVAEIPSLVAVRIRAKVRVGDHTREIGSVVRFRNSPVP